MPIGEWCWPLPYINRIFTDAFLDKLLGINPAISKDERHEFMTYLSKSLSLPIDQKRMVIKQYVSLSEWQFSELNRVFREEKEKFTELERQHPNDIIKLAGKTNLEWAVLLDEKDGAKVFYDIFIDKEDISLGEEIEEIIDRLNDLKQLDVLYLLCAKFIRGRLSEKKYSDYDFFNIVNLYLYASASLGFLRDDHECFQIGLNAINEIDNQAQRGFLEFCFYEYHARLMGFGGISLEVADHLLSSQYKDLSSHYGYLFYVSKINFFVKRQYSEWIFFFVKSVAASLGLLDRKNRRIRDASSLDKGEIFRIIYLVEHLDIYLKADEEDEVDNRFIGLRGVLIEKLTSHDLRRVLNDFDRRYDIDSAIISLKIYALAKHSAVPDSIYRLKNKSKYLELLYLLIVERVEDYSVLSILDEALAEAKEKMDMIYMVQGFITYIMFFGKNKELEEQTFLIFIGSIFSKNTKAKKLYEENDHNIALEYIEYLNSQIKTGAAFDDRSRELMYELLMQQDKTEEKE